MYAAVPRITPAFVAAMLAIVGEFDVLGFDRLVSQAFARPKSRTFTLPSLVNITLPGFKSR
jgi:hypothetical protein